MWIGSNNKINRLSQFTIWQTETKHLNNDHCTIQIFHLCELCCCCCCCSSGASVVSDSMQPHRRQPIRLLCPWDSSDKNTGVGCHFLLQCMKVKSESEVAQSCPTLSDPMDCSLPSSSIHGIFQACHFPMSLVYIYFHSYLLKNIPIDSVPYT